MFASQLLALSVCFLDTFA
ncbi:DUF645 family protein [Vibrio vulnificus]|nr:DUF645 family protein [Vibrio vulnificus]